MALDPQRQDDWGGGIYRGRKAPANAFYDGVNALINDEGFPFKRGGSVYKSGSNHGATLIGLADVLDRNAFGVITGRLILAWSSGTVWTVDDSGTVTSLGTNPIPRALVRGCGVSSSGGSSATWVAPGQDGSAVKDRLILWDGTSVSAQTYAAVTAPEFVATVGTTPRLIVTQGSRAYFSAAGDITSIASTDYHELSQDIQITGADSLQDTALLFTTQGMYGISNMSLDPVDDFGNIQHQVGKLNDLVLWGDPGIAGTAGGLIVPGIEDVYLFQLGAAPQPITGARGNPYDGGIRALYRSYVKAGYQPGIAAVHRGHYFLPIVNGTTWVDTLVCRLDRGFVWTRWSGHSASIGYAQRVGTTTRTPKLWSIAGQRVLDSSSTLDPSSSNPQDADATNFDCTITTRDYPTSPSNQPGFVQRARVKYVLTDDGSGSTAAPTVAIAYSSDQDADSYTTLTEKGEQGGGTGWGTSDGSKYQWALVAKRRDRIRLKITQTGAAASFILRSLELLIRPQGKQ